MRGLCPTWFSRPDKPGPQCKVRGGVGGFTDRPRTPRLWDQAPMVTVAIELRRAYVWGSHCKPCEERGLLFLPASRERDTRQAQREEGGGEGRGRLRPEGSRGATPSGLQHLDGGRPDLLHTRFSAASGRRESGQQRQRTCDHEHAVARHRHLLEKTSLSPFRRWSYPPVHSSLEWLKTPQGYCGLHILKKKI